MDKEIFKKDGTLRIKAPKKYECVNCGNLTSKPSTLKVMGASFYVCNLCTGKITKRDVYTEWEKRKSGQWDMELKILNILSDCEKKTKENIKKLVGSSGFDITFDKSFSDLCYYQTLKIHKSEDEFKYSL